MRARDGGVEMVGGGGSETGLVMKKKGKQKSKTGISASLTPDYRDKEESNNNCTAVYSRPTRMGGWEIHPKLPTCPYMIQS